MSESETQQAILREFGALPWLRIWRANVLVARDSTGRIVRAGIKGQADLSGILKGGRRLEIEVKSPTGRQTKEQRAWQRMIEAHQGLYILARSTGDVWEALAPFASQTAPDSTASPTSEP